MQTVVNERVYSQTGEYLCRRPYVRTERNDECKRVNVEIRGHEWKNYLDNALVGYVLHSLRHDARRRPDVDIRVARQLRKTGYVRLAKVPSGCLVVHHHADIRRAGDLSLRVLVVPADLRRWVSVDVALQDLRRAVLRLHGDWLVPELWPVCENFIFASLVFLHSARLTRHAAKRKKGIKTISLLLTRGY